MCFSGMYEVLVPSSATVIDVSFRAGMVIALAVLLFFSSLIVTAGAIESTPLMVASDKTWIQHFVTLIRSLLMTAFAAVAYTVVHFTANP